MLKPPTSLLFRSLNMQKITTKFNESPKNVIPQKIGTKLQSLTLLFNIYSHIWCWAPLITSIKRINTRCSVAMALDKHVFQKAACSGSSRLSLVNDSFRSQTEMLACGSKHLSSPWFVSQQRDGRLTGSQPSICLEYSSQFISRVAVCRPVLLMQ